MVGTSFPLDWNQAGPTGATGPTGPTGATGPTGPSDAWDTYHDTPFDLTGTGYDTVASLSLPAGNFYVSAKTTVEDTSTRTGVTCTLNDPADTDKDAEETVVDKASIDETNMSVQSTIALSTPGTVKLECSTGGGVTTTFVDYRHMDAIRVATLH